MALAAVTSLLEIVEQDLQQPGLSLTLRNRETIVFLLSGKLRFLQAFLETSKMKTKLDREIRNVAADIQGKIGYKLRPGNFVYGIYQGLYPTLHQAVKDIEAIEISILTAKTNTGMFSGTFQDALEPQDLMIVGLDRDIKMIIYQLASSHLMRSTLLTPMRNRDIDNFLKSYEIPRSKLEVFPLVGEGGIGKTTLAKIVYEDPCIIASFHIRAWVVVSQVHNLREMLIGLLNLKKLTLRYTYLPWKEMGIISKLPILEVLKLKDFAFCGPRWKPRKRRFRGLKVLLIAQSDLKYWKANVNHFPVLEHLVLRFCWDLKKVPMAFANIRTLKFIELESCHSSLLISAEKIERKVQTRADCALRIRDLGTKVELPNNEISKEEWLKTQKKKLLKAPKKKVLKAPKIVFKALKKALRRN